MIKNYILLAVIFITGCSSMSATEKNQKRNELDAMAEATIASLIEKDPQLKEEVENSPGYAVIDAKVTKVPIVGGGGAEGVLINKSQRHVYITAHYIKIDYGHP